MIWEHPAPGLCNARVFGSDFCASLIDAARLATLTPGKVRRPGRTEVEGSARQCQVLGIDDWPKALRDEYLDKMSACVWTHAAECWDITDPVSFSAQLAKYEAGHFHHVHADNAHRLRLISAITWLSTEYEGGETLFPDLDLAVRGAPGDTLLFPAEYLHAADEVTAGEKWVLVASWDPAQ